MPVLWWLLMLHPSLLVPVLRVLLLLFSQPSVAKAAARRRPVSVEGTALTMVRAHAGLGSIPTGTPAKVTTLIRGTPPPAGHLNSRTVRSGAAAG